MEIDLSQLTEGLPASGREPSLTGQVRAIFKVTEAGYVPPGVAVRARIDPSMFTGSFSGAQLPALRTDPRVESLELAERLRQVG